MTLGGIIVLLLLLGLIISSDKFEFIKRRTEKYQKIKEIYLIVIGIILLLILIVVVIKNWGEIDWFQGRGGNPQEGYEDQY